MLSASLNKTFLSLSLSQYFLFKTSFLIAKINTSRRLDLDTRKQQQRDTQTDTCVCVERETSEYSVLTIIGSVLYNFSHTRFDFVRLISCFLATLGAVLSRVIPFTFGSFSHSSFFAITQTICAYKIMT